MQTLSRQHVPDFPDHLPEKVLQFGTGRFLRGFFDAFVHYANESNRFGGRIVAVQSTGLQRAEILNRQDGLYTLISQGIVDGQPVERTAIISSISRALHAESEWESILQVAASSELELIVSNTSEVGLQLDADDDRAGKPPCSFPAKLTALLLHRYRRFGGDPAKAPLIVPCELIIDNGRLLKKLILQTAKRWQLEPGFIEWVNDAVPFCNTLVDRIVTDAPPAGTTPPSGERQDYEDDLRTCAEHYSLFAIEGVNDSAALKALAEANPSIILTDDISRFRQLKLRLLNATHTISVPLAYLCGCNTVLEMISDEATGRFVESVMRSETAPSLDIDPAITATYAGEVLERFRNPFLRHQLLNITFEQSSKMRVRVLPIVQKYIEKFAAPPPLITFGFAACLLFMKSDLQQDGGYAGRRLLETYSLNDQVASRLSDWWSSFSGEPGYEDIERICTLGDIWRIDLNELPGFAQSVYEHLQAILKNGAAGALREMLTRER